MAAVRAMLGERAVEILRHARELIADPADWGQWLAVMERGARRRCAGQAIELAALGAIQGMEALAFGFFCHAAEVDIANALDNFDEAIEAVSDWNDSHTHAEVLAVFDRAIALVEGTMS